MNAGQTLMQTKNARVVKNKTLNIFKNLFGQIMGGDRESVQVIDSLKSGCYKITIEDRQNRRSIEQNSYYWGVVIKTLIEHDQEGVTGEQIHQALKCGIFGTVLACGIVVPLRDTKGLNVREFEEYLSHVRTWACNKRNIYIPKPRESGFGFDLREGKNE